MRAAKAVETANKARTRRLATEASASLINKRAEHCEAIIYSQRGIRARITNIHESGVEQTKLVAVSQPDAFIDTVQVWVRRISTDLQELVTPKFDHIPPCWLSEIEQSAGRARTKLRTWRSQLDQAPRSKRKDSMHRPWS